MAAKTPKQKARDRALSRLRDNHLAEYERLFSEECNRPADDPWVSKRAKMPPEERARKVAQIHELHAAGAFVKEIMEKTGLSYGFVWRELHPGRGREKKWQ